VAVQEEPEVVAPTREHDPLIGRGFGEDHFIRVEALFGVGGQAIRVDESREEEESHRADLPAKRSNVAELLAEEPSRPAGDDGVENSKEKTGADQTELRREHDRKQQRRDQRAEIIERQHLGHEVLELQPSLEDSQQERNLEAD